MSVDIVTRLRKKLVMEALGDKATYLTLGDCLDAADEIERLRQEFNNVAAQANAYYELVQAYRWSHSHLGEWPDAISSLVAENHELRKAVRGE